MGNTYVNADIRLDPDGKLLPTDRYMELHAGSQSNSPNDKNLVISRPRF